MGKHALENDGLCKFLDGAQEVIDMETFAKEVLWQQASDSALLQNKTPAALKVQETIQEFVGIGKTVWMALRIALVTK
eukprot:6704493-Karenia_brevis.AAC.1